MEQNRLIKWHDAGYPPIDLNKEVSSVAHLIQDNILLEQRNKLLTEALKMMYETCNPKDVTYRKNVMGLDLGEYYVGSKGIPSDEAIHKAKEALKQAGL